MDKVKGPVTLEGVQVIPISEISDHRGAVLHMLRRDAPYFRAFGEVYFSEIRPKIIKAWKRHRKLTQNLTVPVGRIRLVMYDDRLESATRGKLVELIVGRPDHYILVIIPPLVWYGFQCISDSPACIANCIDYPYDAAETDSMDIEDQLIPYRWPRLSHTKAVP